RGVDPVARVGHAALTDERRDVLALHRLALLRRRAVGDVRAGYGEARLDLFAFEPRHAATEHGLSEEDYATVAGASNHEVVRALEHDVPARMLQTDHLGNLHEVRSGLRPAFAGSGCDWPPWAVRCN